MNKISYVFACILLSLAIAQNNNTVTKSMIGSFNFTQSSHDNWVQGGEDVLSWFLDIKGDYKKESERSIFQGSGHANYGKTKISDTDARKSMDELKLDLLYTMKMGWTVNPYISAQLLSQLAPGYAYTDTNKTQISAFMDPGYLIQTMGIGYSIDDKFAARFGASVKESVSDQYPIPNAENPDATPDKIRTEFGFQSEFDIKKQFGEKTAFTSEIDIFSNLEGFDLIDVIWDTNLNTKISEYLQFGFQYKIVYDRDVSPKRQIKSVLSLGLNYTFL
ncbi:MAG: DUF3078 domain-containing protein [Candidatus Marinimicrobia bacterium]|nr:DUF3078 domain-containing protein [Candidatus Neomarinimicrobiota bacterium]